MQTIKKTFENAPHTKILIKTEDFKSWLNNVEITDEYRPSENEEYMSNKQLKYFQTILLIWREKLLIESEHTIISLKNIHLQEPDESDRASSESEANLELRTRERFLKLVSKIDQALKKIENKTYGYCEISDEEIGLKRLEARPVALFSVQEQEKRELKEKLVKRTNEEDIL